MDIHSHIQLTFTGYHLIARQWSYQGDKVSSLGLSSLEGGRHIWQQCCLHCENVP